MALILQSCRIIDPQSSHHLSTVDLRVEGGHVKGIGKDLPVQDTDQVISLEGRSLAPSWVDIGTFSGEPGYEERENFDSLSEAALAGGFGTLVMSPETDPIPDHSAIIRSFPQRIGNGRISLQPMGTLSAGRRGEELAELMDMADSGAVAFSDGNRALLDDAFMLKVLEYSKTLSQPIFHCPHQHDLVPHAQMNEGRVALKLGLRSWPALSETMLMERDLSLVEYTQSPLIWHEMTTEKGAALLEEAQKKGLPIVGGVHYLHLCYTDAELKAFDVNFKLSPPLRSESDRKALWEAIRRGVVGYACSGHRPHDQENKKVEFPYAEFGAEGLETAFSTFLYHCPFDDPQSLFVELFSVGPRKVLNLEPVIVEEGGVADFTVFDPEIEWTFSAANIRSLSDNNPNVGRPQRGKVLGRCIGEQLIDLEHSFT